MSDKAATFEAYKKLLRDAEQFYSAHPEFSWVGNIEEARALGVPIKGEVNKDEKDI